MTPHEPVRGTTRPHTPDWACRRCGTTNHRNTPDGSPWCSDCLGAIALDPAYLRNHHDAQAILDRWVNGRRGSRKRILATTTA